MRLPLRVRPAVACGVVERVGVDGAIRCGIDLPPHRDSRARAAGIERQRVQALKDRATAGEPKASLAREFGISRQTLYQYIRLPEPTAS